jgi:hypothetical protein
MVGAPIKTPTSSSSPPPAQKPRPAGPAGERAPRGKGRWPTVVRVLISLLIVWHFTSIFVAALCIPGPSSPLAYKVHESRPMQWYLNALYLNQGHSFFAPDVGPGHLIHYELFDRSNRLLEESSLPSKKEHWPRLLYHRYFMLADQTDGWFQNKQDREFWQRQFLEAFGRHLLSLNKDAQSVRIRRYAHWPLPVDYLIQDPNNPVPDRKRGYERMMGDMQREGEPHRLDDQGFEMIGEASQTRADLPPDPGQQSLDWENVRANTASRQYGPWGVNR